MEQGDENLRLTWPAVRENERLRSRAALSGVFASANTPSCRTLSRFKQGTALDFTHRAE